MKNPISKFIFILMIPGILFSENIYDLTTSKLSPDLQNVISEKSLRDNQLIDVPSSRVQTVKGPLQEVLYPVTIRSTDIEAVKAAGIKTNSDYPGFSTARVTREQLQVLSELGAVTSVFQGDVLYPLNDLAVSLAGADLAHDGYLNSTAYDGTGVIVLVIDTGIDWSHLDFRDPLDNTKSRILYIWDMTLTTGTSTPYHRDSKFGGLNYGVEYTNAQINAELDGSNTGIVLSKDTNGHGTEVTGAAAGNGASALNGKYKGMAPGADIVVVRAGVDNFLDEKVIDALTYAQKIDSSENKPVVVNLSLGSQSNAHDGTSTLDQAVNSYTTSGTGRAAVVAAGNAGNEDIHVTGNVAKSGGTANITINVPTNTSTSGDQFKLELWWSDDDNVIVTLNSPNDPDSQVRVNDADPGGGLGTDDGAVDMNNIIDPDHSNGDRMTELIVFDYSTVHVAAGTWTLQLKNNSTTKDMTYHAWLYYSSMGATVTGGDHNSTIASPGTASSAITVGSYTARWRWKSTFPYFVNFGDPDESEDHSYFSSYGPTREGGVQKPDIMTPGQGVITTTSTSATFTQNFINAYEIVTDKYHLESGTSVAAGSISGAVALLLDKDGTLTASDVKTLLTDNADSDDTYTGSVPNTEWGYGKLNIFESLADAIGGSTTLNHKINAHDAWDLTADTVAFHAFAKDVKEAVKFTTVEAGDVTGALFCTYQIVPSTGKSISFEIWSDESGIPGTKVGSTVTMDCGDIAKNTWNYVSLTGAGVSAAAATNFHLVLDNTSDSIFSLIEGVTNISNRSSNDRGPGWAALTDRDWRMRAIVSNNAAVTDATLPLPPDESLPVELAFFNAGTYKGQMVLKWATESETENQGFRIDRRKSSTEDWELIADHTKDPKLEGQGNSTSRTDYSYYDKTAKPGVKYDYRLTDIPYTSAYQPNSIVLEDIQLRIEKFMLHKNFPNPFNPATTIGYELPKNSDVQIKIIDVNGREVQSWTHQDQDEGYHEMVWAGVDHAGKPVSAGLYLLTVQAGKNFQSRKLLLLK